jgi:flagellar secretion chaperone FliS
MYNSLRMRQYQQQAVMTCSPEQLILKLYDAGITSCAKGDPHKLRAILVELIGSLNFDEGGEIASRLHSIYEYCIVQSNESDLSPIADILSGLRDTWREAVIPLKAA